MRSFLTLILIAAAMAVPSQAAPKPGDSLGDLQAEGKVYASCKLVSAEPDGITITYSTGVAKLYFSQLPEEIQTAFSYDPAKAKDYAAEVKAREGATYEKYAPEKNTQPSPGPAVLTLPSPVFDWKQREIQRTPESRNKIEEIISRRRQEEEEAALRRQEANERTKEKLKKKKSKKQS